MVVATRTDGETDYVLITRTNFRDNEGFVEETVSRTLPLAGRLARVLFCCNLYVPQASISSFVEDPGFVNGVKGKLFVHLGEEGLRHFAVIKRGTAEDALEFFKVPASLTILLQVSRISVPKDNDMVVPAAPQEEKMNTGSNNDEK